MFENFLNWLKTWIKETGVVGWLGAVAGVVLWLGGFKLWAMFSFGIFACKNWEWIKNGINRLLDRN